MAIGKKTLYIFVPVNICVWGMIGYKLYSAFNDQDTELTIEKPIVTLNTKEDTATYQLSLNYPDPFLKEEPNNRPKQKNSNAQNTSFKANVASKKPLPIVPTPSKEIRYLGLIQNKSSGTATALISINGVSYIIKKGEVIDGVHFESITDQTILAKIGKEKLTINKS